MKPTTSNTIPDRLVMLCQQEATRYSRTARGRPDLSYIDDTTGSWRAAIIPWMKALSDTFRLQPAVLGVAVYYLDQCVHLHVVQDAFEYQLAALTSFHMAMKLYESKIFPMQEMLKLGHGRFSQEQVEDMEARLCQAFGWHLHPVTPSCVVQELLSAVSSSSSHDQQQEQSIRHMAHSIIHLSYAHEDLLDYSAVTIGYASLVLAMEHTGVDGSVFQEFLRTAESWCGCKLQTPHMLALLKDLEGYMMDANLIAVDSHPQEQDEQSWQAQQQAVSPTRPKTSPARSPRHVSLMR